MKFSSLLRWLTAGIFCTGNVMTAAPAEAANWTPEQAMVDLTAEISSYAKAKQPGFQIVGNGAVGLLEVTETEPQESVDKLTGALDGVLAESVFFCATDDGITEQNPDVLAYLDAMLQKPLTSGKAVWTLDYLPDEKQRLYDDKLGRERGYTSLAVARNILDTIPEGTVTGENNRDIQSVTDAGNFLVLLNPGRFESRSDYLEALALTSYDVLVIDAYYSHEPLTSDEVAGLKQKPQGGKRLVLAYMSVGEAADYRPFWQASWNDDRERPAWIAGANPKWPGAYRVRYWAKPWKRILYGRPDSYLDGILQAGFDGVFLDVMDAWQTFR